MYLIFDISVSCDNLLIFINNVDELSVCWRKIGGVGCHHVGLTKVQNTNEEAKIMFFRMSRISTRVLLLL